MAVTAALAASMALAFPRLRGVLLLYLAAVALTRVVFGAHFPIDVLAGTMLGIGSALLVAELSDRIAGRASTVGAAEPYDPDAPVVAVMPSYNDVPSPALVASTLEHVDLLVLVDDGSDAAIAGELDAIATDSRIELVRLPERGGKGSAVRAGVARARDRAAVVVVVDADGQHPPHAIPAFVAAAGDAELVVGDRFGDLRRMPRHRRIANRTTRRLFQLITGREVRDTQNGMRLIRGRALDLVPDGGYEAETRHLREVLQTGLPVAWVPIPAIYENERSSFRAGRDSLRVLWALVQPL
jgi:dolichol-phosphate mannosyltransferase